MRIIPRYSRSSSASYSLLHGKPSQLATYMGAKITSYHVRHPSTHAQPVY